MKKIFPIIVFSCALAAFAQDEADDSAQEQDVVFTSIAVLPSEGYGFVQEEYEKLTDKMREAALKVLPRETFLVLTQDAVIKRLGGEENYKKQCTASSCILALGDSAKADFVTRADIVRRGKVIDLRVELYNVKTQGQIGILTGDAKKFEDVLGIVEKKAPIDVFGKIPGAQKPAGSVAGESAKISFWTGIGLEALGAAVMFAGYMKHQEMQNAHDRYKEKESDFGDAWDKVESNRKTRDILYIAGGVLLASGIGVHIWF